MPCGPCGPGRDAEGLIRRCFAGTGPALTQPGRPGPPAMTWGRLGRPRPARACGGDSERGTDPSGWCAAPRAHRGSAAARAPRKRRRERTAEAPPRAHRGSVAARAPRKRRRARTAQRSVCWRRPHPHTHAWQARPAWLAGPSGPESTRRPARCASREANFRAWGLPQRCRAGLPGVGGGAAAESRPVRRRPPSRPPQLYHSYRRSNYRHSRYPQAAFPHSEDNKASITGQQD
jgi:hypothetical protein